MYRYLMVLLSVPYLAQAEALLIAPRGPLLNTATPLIQVSQPASSPSSTEPSLFAGKSGNSLFKPLPPRLPRNFSIRGSSRVDQLRNLIGQAESVLAGYDAVQHGARIRPGKRPTQMTLGEIYDWIDDTPGQPHAIGRYQFIPKTLRRLARKLGVARHERFTEQLQDQLSDVLLAEAGLYEFERGQLSRHAFMHNLSKIWAGLPTSTGKSYYHGFAGNKASITWTHFDAEMTRIFG